MLAIDALNGSKYFQCIDSAMSGSYCPSKKKERMVEWGKLGEKTFGPGEFLVEFLAHLQSLTLHS